MNPRDAEPTEQHLRAAFRRLATSPRWPATLDEALQHPQFGLAIRAVARRMACQPPAVPPAAAAPAPMDRPVTPPTPPAIRPTRDLFDPKRAAAHDRDDD